jgi:hypothetical protein
VRSFVLSMLILVMDHCDEICGMVICNIFDIFFDKEQDKQHLYL